MRIALVLATVCTALAMLIPAASAETNHCGNTANNAARSVVGINVGCKRAKQVARAYLNGNARQLGFGCHFRAFTDLEGQVTCRKPDTNKRVKFFTTQGGKG